jgi:hypothetical protein
MLAHSLTDSISIAAPPRTVLELLADPLQLPRWAPDFAQRVRPDGEVWMVESAGQEFPIELRVDRTLGVVDILRPGTETGAFARVVPNGDGSEMVFTLFFPPGASAEQIERQREVVAAELERVRSLTGPAT